MAAIVHSNLIAQYVDRNLEGHTFLLQRFKIEPHDQEYPRFEGYTFLRCETNIIIRENTNLEPVSIDPFPCYPLVRNIDALLNDHTRETNLIGNIFFFLLIILLLCTLHKIQIKTYFFLSIFRFYRCCW